MMNNFICLLILVPGFCPTNSFGQEKVTAQYYYLRADSIAHSLLDEVFFIKLRSENVDSLGISDYWEYAYQNLYMYFSKDSSVVDTTFGEWTGSSSIKNGWLDSDSIKGKSSMRTSMDHAGTNEQRILLGTKMLTRRLNADIRVSMAAILNADHFLNLPDFRSAEKTYHEIVSVADKVAPGGEILIQTRMPQHDVFKALKTNIADGFFQEELRRRKSLLYPPFSRLILIKCISKRSP